jgi:hypothetical protein
MFQVRQPHTQQDTQSSHTQSHTVSSSDEDPDTTINTNPSSPRQRHDSTSSYSLPIITVPKRKKKELKQSKQDISNVLVDLLKSSRNELIQSQKSVIEVCYSNYDHWAAFL